MFNVFVNVLYDQYVGLNLCWWQVSGVDLWFDLSGLKLNMQLFVMVIFGGIVFQMLLNQGSGVIVLNNMMFCFGFDEGDVMCDLDGQLL